MIKKIKTKIKSIVFKKASKSIFWSNIYYGLVDSSFSRTHFSTLAGIKKHKSNMHNIAFLTRNIHRIEKGLIHPNPKSVFAEGFIKDTVKSFIDLKDKIDSSRKEYFESVLNLYFKTVTIENTKVNDAFKLFSKEVTNQSISKVPFKREERNYSTINYNQFLELCKKRRSVRYFQDKAIDEDLINLALNAASQSPSACNRQPFRLIASQDKEFKNKMGKIPMGADTFYKNVPMFISVIGDLSSYEYERDKNLIYIDGSLFVMSFVLALETLGLSSCTINWPDIETKEKELEKLLNLKPYERCIMFIAVGYADLNGKIPYSEKKSAKELITYIK